MNLAAAIQQQLLQTLIAALAPVPTLVAGDVIEGRITKLAPDGQATLQTAQGTVNVTLAQGAIQSAAQGNQSIPPLQLGQILKLEIAGTAEAGALTARIIQARNTSKASGAASGTSQTNIAQAGNTITPPAPTPVRITAALITAPALQTQDSLAPLFANLSAVASAGVQAYLPTAVINAATRLLGFRLPTDVPPTADDLRKSVARSGLFREARLIPDSIASTLPADLKSALVALRDALGAALSSAGADGNAHASSETPEQSGYPDIALPEGKTAEVNLRSSRGADGAASQDIAPPRRNGQPVPQGATQATLDVKTATPEAVLRVLSNQTEAALDRQSLLQVASLPPNAADIRHEGGAVQRWFTEIPMQLDTRTPILPLEIERDRRTQRGQAGDQPTWKVRFALDGEPLGVLHALVMMQGRRLGVTFWAERETTRAALRHSGPDLSAALEGPYFTEASVEIQAGQPFVSTPETSGQFVDTRT
jgi:Flagellar hook-length control protein FliK